jgi:hypothetical protein
MFLHSGSVLISCSLPRDPIASFGNMIVRAESIIRAEENAVGAIQIVIVSLETPVRCIPLTFIAEWLT